MSSEPKKVELSEESIKRMAQAFQEALASEESRKSALEKIEAFPEAVKEAVVNALPEVVIGKCPGPDCGQEVHIKELMSHMPHIKSVEKIVEKPVEKVVEKEKPVPVKHKVEDFHKILGETFKEGSLTEEVTGAIKSLEKSMREKGWLEE